MACIQIPGLSFAVTNSTVLGSAGIAQQVGGRGHDIIGNGGNPVPAVKSAPPGDWEGNVVLVGKGTDGNLWQTVYDTTTGKWSAPVKL